MLTFTVNNYFTLVIDFFWVLSVLSFMKKVLVTYIHYGSELVLIIVRYRNFSFGLMLHSKCRQIPESDVCESWLHPLSAVLLGHVMQPFPESVFSSVRTPSYRVVQRCQCKDQCWYIGSQDSRIIFFLGSGSYLLLGSLVIYKNLFWLGKAKDLLDGPKVVCVGRDGSGNGSVTL